MCVSHCFIFHFYCLLFSLGSLTFSLPDISIIWPTPQTKVFQISFGLFSHCSKIYVLFSTGMKQFYLTSFSSRPSFVWLRFYCKNIYFLLPLVCLRLHWPVCTSLERILQINNWAFLFLELFQKCHHIGNCLNKTFLSFAWVENKTTISLSQAFIMTFPNCEDQFIITKQNI